MEPNSNKSKAKIWLCRIFKVKDRRKEVPQGSSDVDVSSSETSEPTHCARTSNSFRRSLRKMQTSVKSCVFRQRSKMTTVVAASTSSLSSNSAPPPPPDRDLEPYRRPTDEIGNLLFCCWYWGPMTTLEAEEMLKNQPDGAFLVRDSSSASYLFSISFRSVGKTMHARIDCNRGKYNLYGSFTEGFSTVAELVQDAVRTSENGVYCYSRRGENDCNFPVRLTKPVSRYTQVRSLKYLSRFVIRQCTNINDIPKLPLPTVLYGYLLERPYF